ncbi:MAG: helix-turn-helix domain-containing protein [Bacteroidota bacterium]|nr:helix-turn-helix domain-containing protein [Bacteroidota bacterium]
MFVKHYAVHPALTEFVSRILLIHYKLDTTKAKPVNPFPPQPEHCLYFYPYDKVNCHNSADQSTKALPQSIIVGPQLSLVNLSMGYNTLVIYVGFLPGGLHRLLRVPMVELCDRSFDSTLFLSKEINEVTDQINEQDNYDKVIRIVETFLLRKSVNLKPILPIDRVLRKMTNAPTLTNINIMASEACVSVRQLERQFKERIGMAPKVFTKLVRFSRAWNLHEANPQISWNQMAHHFKYADHMHLIREFKQFTGTLPSQLKHNLEKSPLRLQADLNLYGMTTNIKYPPLINITTQSIRRIQDI